MAPVSNGFPTRPTAVGSIVLALASVSAVGCGGKGERLKPDVTTTIDAGFSVNPCNLSATVETHLFGCPDNRATGTYRGVFCTDWEGYGDAHGGAPTGGFVYPDAIAPSLKPGLVPVTDPPGPGLSYTTVPAADASCGSANHAFHFTAQNELVWGPQFGVQFTANTDSVLPAVDVSDWEGMAFWIRQGTDPAHPEFDPTGTTVFVSLRDPNTMSLEQGGQLCNDKSNFDREKCDPYGAAVGFNTTWRYVMLPIDEMKQRGYGVREDELVKTQIKKLTFSMDIGDAANGNWNLWVDDIVLYRRK